LRHRTFGLALLFATASRFIPSMTIPTVLVPVNATNVIFLDRPDTRQKRLRRFASELGKSDLHRERARRSGDPA